MGPVDKRKGLFAKRRQLILTDRPRIIYVDEEKMIQKGEIPWSEALKPEYKNKRNFFVHTVCLLRSAGCLSLVSSYFFLLLFLAKSHVLPRGLVLKRKAVGGQHKQGTQRSDEKKVVNVKQNKNEGKKRKKKFHFFPSPSAFFFFSFKFSGA